MKLADGWPLLAVAATFALTALAPSLFASDDERLLVYDAPTPKVCLDTSNPSPQGGMVWVPPGEFDLGDTVYPEEGPVTRTKVGGFWMDTHEVTNAQFAAFVKATGYVTQAERAANAAAHQDVSSDMLAPGAMVFFLPKDVQGLENIAQWWRYVPGANWRHPAGPGSSIDGRENYPVVEITLADAQAYARWKGRELPTEAEWEWAARDGNPNAGEDHDQPAGANTWQGVFPVINSGDDGFVGLAPVGCYPKNAYGLYDMLGNVWELTRDDFRPRHGIDADALAAPSRGGGAKQVTIKGGSFLCAQNYCMRYRSGSREPQEADLATSHLGFRTISHTPPK